METIIVVIAADGSVSIEANGMKGAACSLATAQLEAALGKAQSVKLKREYFDGPANLNKIGGGK